MYLNEMNDAVKELAKMISWAETPERVRSICNEWAPEIDFEDAVCLLHNYQTRMVVSKPDFSRAMLAALIKVLQSSRGNQLIFANEFSSALTKVCRIEEES